MGLLSDQCAEWFPLSRRLKEWSTMECHCYLRNTQDLLSDGETPNERRFGVPFKFRLKQWSNTTVFLRKTNLDYINSVQKSCQVYSLDMHCTWRIWKGDMLVADIEEWEQMDASETFAKRLSAKEVLTPIRVYKFIFPIADEKVKLTGWDQVLRPSTLIRDRPERWEAQGNLQGESDGSSSTPLQDSSWYDGEARNDFWSISGNFIYRHHVEPRVKLYVPKEESFAIPLRCIDVTSTTNTSLVVMLEKHIDDYWNVDGDREVSDSWTGFKRFNCVEWKSTGWLYMVRGETDKKTNDMKAGLSVARDLEKDMSDASKLKEKQKWAIEKPKLDSARRLRGVCFVDPADKDFKDIMKNVRRKEEMLMPAAIICKLQRDTDRETCRTVEEPKTKYACIVQADESLRNRMEGYFFTRIMKIALHGKGLNSLSHNNFARKFILMPSSCNETTRCKGSSGENMRKTQEDTRMAADKCQKQKLGDRRSKE